MVGSALAQKEKIHVGDILSLKGTKMQKDLKVTGIFNAGGDEDNQIFTPLHIAQALDGLEGKVDSIEVSALTTPDNDLAKRAAKDPKSLTVA